MIHGNGVTPNIRVPMSAGAGTRGCSPRATADKIRPDEEKSMIKANDPQMLRAIDALKGVMIYAQQNAPKGEAVKK